MKRSPPPGATSAKEVNVMHHRRIRHAVLRPTTALLALAVLLILPSAALAAGGWHAQASGTPQDLAGVAASGGRLWAAGAGGTILTSLNGGATWVAQGSGTTQGLHAVAFTDATHGWAVGDGGTILTTGDAGATWTAQSSGTTQNLRAVAFADPTHGWAVGDGGTLLGTVDGGATWTPQSLRHDARPLRRRLQRREHGLGGRRRRRGRSDEQRRRRLDGAELGHYP